MNTRAVVAMSGTFGYELDLNLIGEEEKKQVPIQIESFKKYWNLLHNGEYYRLTNVLENTSEAAWMMVSDDKEEALINIVMLNATGNCPNKFIRCAGLMPSVKYQDEESGKVYSSNALMTMGIPIPQKILGEYEAMQIHLRRVI